MSAANDRVSGPGTSPVSFSSIAGPLPTNVRRNSSDKPPPRLVAEHETVEPLGGRVWSTVGFGLINGSTQPSVVAGL